MSCFSAGYSLLTSWFSPGCSLLPSWGWGLFGFLALLMSGLVLESEGYEEGALPEELHAPIYLSIIKVNNAHCIIDRMQLNIKV